MNLSVHTRLRGAPRWLGAVLLGLLALACAMAALSPPASSLEGAAQATAQRRDVDLYAAITARVAAGEDYYRAAADEQRASAYPVVPVFALRLPVLAWFNAALGLSAARIVMALLAAATAWAWLRRLDASPPAPFRPLFGAVLVGWGLGMVLHPAVVHLHEAWAGLLIALALALHDPARPGPALVAALAAVLLRELALPFVLLMGALALWGRRWGEAGLWAAVTALFALAVAFHSRAHAGVALPGDLASPGWLTLPGLAGYTGKVLSSSLLTVLPTALGSALAVLALAGWWAWDGLLGLTGSLLHSGYAVFFALFGRGDNYYWGFMTTPTLLLGLLVLPALLRDLRLCLMPAQGAGR